MKKINTFIDRCLIDSYASQNFIDGHYCLDLDDIPPYDLANFLDVLMDDDTTIRDVVRHHMQDLINKRIAVLPLPERSAA